MSKAIVHTESLSKIYLRGKTTALEEINLRIDEGEFVSIVGQSGSGKTTLLNILGALDNPTQGKVFINGLDLSKVKNMNRFRAEKVGFIFQLHNLIPTLSAYENVQLPMLAVKMDSGQRKMRAMEMLEMVGLKDKLYHIPTMLSGGERQRVAIARALTNKPPLVLGDEPTGNLDAGTGEEVTQLMFELNRQVGTTFIIATHDMKIVKKTERIIHLDNGRIVDRGRKSAFLRTPCA
ncbi:ABC transporter ATP-binding protein [Chloroflexota bacterium]